MHLDLLSIPQSGGKNVLVAHVDMFEQSSSPPERNTKWPKTEHIMAKNRWKLSKVAITGSTRPLLAKNGR